MVLFAINGVMSCNLNFPIRISLSDKVSIYASIYISIGVSIYLCIIDIL